MASYCKFFDETKVFICYLIELDGFCQHATEKHELSKVLFGDKINSENSDVADIKIEPAIEMYDNNGDMGKKKLGLHDSQ